MSTSNTKYNSKSIAVIMCTKNGENYIENQLHSILRQEHKNIEIYISDNNSRDSTVDIIKKFKVKNNDLQIHLLRGNDGHFANNFINLARTISKDYDYYAFCDQDDTWDSCHTLRGIKKLEDLDLSIPALYCSRTNLIDEKGRMIGKSKLFKRKPSFNNALVQSIAGGNTMIFNRLAFNLVEEIREVDLFIPSHDWMLYLLVSGSGGFTYYEKKPSVNYRQHKKNAIGSNLGIKNATKRAIMIFKGDWGKWLDANYLLLINYPNLTQKNKCILENFQKLRMENNLILRIKKYLSSSIYRQTPVGEIALLVALIIKKL